MAIFTVPMLLYLVPYMTLPFMYWSVCCFECSDRFLTFSVRRGASVGPTTGAELTNTRLGVVVGVSVGLRGPSQQVQLPGEDLTSVRSSSR